uniref:Helicase ssl-1 n=1 Tax=Parascaris univalens TaxID=6257 RepID=A0A915AGW7_PARUN
ECENDGLPSIPDCLRLDNVIRGSHFAHSEMRRLCVKKALIEELSQQETGSAMPKVEGFKFVRPPPPPKQMKHPDVQGGQLSTNVAAVSVPAGSLPQSGEYYVCVDNGTARVYQLVTTSSGERTIRECDPTAVAGSAATATPIMAAVEVPALPIQVASPPLISVVAQPVATQPGVEVKTEVKTESIVEVVGAPSEQRAPASTESEKPADRRAVFRTRTIMNKAIIRTGQALKQELTAVNNGCTSIHEGRQVMIPVGSTIPYQTAASTESPTRSRCVAQPETHLAQKERRQACVQRIAEMCARRIEWPNSRRAPLVSDELLSILIDEVKKKHRRKPRSEHGRAQCVELNAFECWEDLGWIHDRLRLLVEDMVDRFTVFVHGAIADAPKLEPTSVGRVAYRKQLAQERADICRRIFELDDPLVAKCRMMQMLQFPELRLIEYDCGKLQVLSSLLRDLFLYKHRCLIFTQMSRMLDVLQAFLSFHGYQYFRLDGTTGIEQRQAMMERFNSDPKIFCFILSTRSGGIGVNLTGADTVIFYDSDWNPTMDAQAQDRCHRIGQTRNVTIYRLISERTIEENILKKAMQKRRLGELAIDEGGFTPEFFKGDNLRELFQGEAAVADVVVPVTVSDVAELEKAMAKLEDVQDVAAAKRANAEAKAELAEFDESVLPNGDNSSNTIDRADSKYFELISQLKPIERYAINFLEAEYKPDFEEEVKEAEAMIASKKDEWLKAHETVMEGEPNEGDDEFDLTYSNGFGVAGSVDEVRNRRYKSASNTVTTKNPPPQKTRIVPVRSSSRIVAPPKILPPPSAATKLSRPQRRTLSDTTRSGNKTTTASSSSERPRRASSKKEYTTVANDNTLKLSKRRTTMDVNKVVEGDSDGKSKKRSKNELSLRKEGSVVVVDSDDEHSLASSSNEKDVYQKARSRNRQKNPLFSPTFAVPPSKNNSSDEPIPSSSSASGPVEYAQPSASNLRDFRKPQALGSVPLVMAPLSPTSFVPSTRSFVRPSPSVRNMMPSASVRCASLQSAQRTGYSGGVVQRYVTAPSQLPTAQSAATYMLATTQPTTISRPLQRAAASTSVQRRFVMVSRSSQDATSCPGQNALRLPVAVVSNAGATYRVVNAVRPGTNTNLVAQSSQQMASSSARRNIRITSTGTSYSNYSGMSRVASTSRSACVGYTKPSLGDYERPRLFFRKRPPLPSDDFTTASTGVSNNSSIDGKCADSTSS